MTDLEIILQSRLDKRDIRRVTEWASQSADNRDILLAIAFSGDHKKNSNALWCLTHLRKSDSLWLQSKQDSLIDSLLREKNTARKRMILQLLRDQVFLAEDIRVDFLDFCMSKINSECEPYAIRCFSLYLASKLCRHYPELILELKERISLLSREPLSPGLRCAIRKVSRDIGL